MRAAPEVDAADRLDAERGHVVEVAAHDPFEAVSDPDDLHVLHARADRGRADHAVDTGGRATSDEDGELLVLSHSDSPFESALREPQLPEGLLRGRQLEVHRVTMEDRWHFRLRVSIIST